MDGTIYKGGTLFEATDPFLRLMREMGIGYTFLTNNPSKNIRDYLAHLQKMGIGATPDQLYTSAQATICAGVISPTSTGRIPKNPRAGCQ